jgi:hypothetical protein
LGNSVCALRTPASASFQKSDAPFTTKARVFLSAACAPLPNASASPATAASRAR